MNQHIEYFKRWSECYLSWSHSNMDRIARETAAKYNDEFLADRKERNKSPLWLKISEIFNSTTAHFANEFAKDAMKDLVFYGQSQWKVGDKIKVITPEEYFK